LAASLSGLERLVGVGARVETARDVEDVARGGEDEAGDVEDVARTGDVSSRGNRDRETVPAITRKRYRSKRKSTEETDKLKRR